MAIKHGIDSSNNELNKDQLFADVKYITNLLKEIEKTHVFFKKKINII